MQANWPSQRFLAAVASAAVIVFCSFPAYSMPTTFRGCFVSGPTTGGAADAEFNGDVDTITGALVGTGSWMEGNITDLKTGKRADIETCVGNAKIASVPGDEFAFYFAGHGGDFLGGGGEVGEGGGTDNHILIGDTTVGTRDRITDDQLADLLSGFKKSVTISVILDSCLSHTFSDGADDLGSVTQVNGNPVLAGDHLALSAASSPTTPTCGGGYTRRLADGLTIMAGMFRADTNKDGTVTTEEATRFASGFTPTLAPRCEPEVSCPIPSTQFSTFFGSEGCGPADPVCPILAEMEVPEPGSLALLLTALLAGTAPFAAVALRRARRAPVAQRRSGEG
jgi:hypothetical protein